MLLSKTDRAVFLLMLLLTIFFLTAAGLSVLHNKNISLIEAEKLKIAASPEQVIGSNPVFQGDTHNAYTLVEFGDYQCPPCQAANGRVQSALRHYHGKLRFVFRNLPLTTLHPYAMSAATVAEAAKAQGKFWAAHDLLYSYPDTSRAISAIESTGNPLRLNRKAFDVDRHTVAERAIETDINETKALGLHGTPTFFLCLPNRKVVQLHSIDQLKNFL